MDIKIIAGILLLTFAIGFVFLNTVHLEHPENKQNLSSNNTKNTTVVNNLNSNIIKIEENKSINKTDISQENFSENIFSNYSYTLPNASCKKYIFVYSSYASKDSTFYLEKNFTITTYLKGMEENEGRKYILVESKPSLTEDSEFRESSSNHACKMFEKSPQKSEIVDMYGALEEAITKEYVDIESGEIKIISIPLGTIYKIENNTIYEKKEFFPESKRIYEYNFTDYTKINSTTALGIPDMTIFFLDLLNIHPLYAPGFINFEIHNLTENININDIKIECSKEKTVPAEDFWGRTVYLYNCTKTFTVNHIRKADEKPIINETYVGSENFASSVREHINVNEYGALLQNMTKRLEWKGIEKINGREGYKIEYFIKSSIFDSNRITLWIDKNDKILLGIKWDNSIIKPYANYDAGWMPVRSYMFVDEINSC